MQRVRIKGGATAGVALVTAALSLAACSSSGSSSPSSSTKRPHRAAALPPSSRARLTGAGRRSRLTFQQTAIQSFKSIQSGLTVNYGGGGSGTGRTTWLGDRQLRGLGLCRSPPLSCRLFKGKTVLYFPVVIGPITVSYNLSGVSKP